VAERGGCGILTQHCPSVGRRTSRALPVSLRHFPLDVAFLVLLALVIFAEYAVAQSLMDIGVRLRGPGAI